MSYTLRLYKDEWNMIPPFKLPQTYVQAAIQVRIFSWGTTREFTSESHTFAVAALDYHHLVLGTDMEVWILVEKFKFWSGLN